MKRNRFAAVVTAMLCVVSLTGCANDLFGTADDSDPPRTPRLPRAQPMIDCAAKTAMAPSPICFPPAPKAQISRW